MKVNPIFHLHELDEFLSFPNFSNLEEKTTTNSTILKLENLGYSARMSSKKTIQPENEDLYYKILLGAKNAYLSVIQEESGGSNAHFTNSPEKPEQKNNNDQSFARVNQEYDDAKVNRNIQVNDAKGVNEISRKRKLTGYINFHSQFQISQADQIKNIKDSDNNIFHPMKKIKNNSQNQSKQPLLTNFFKIK